MMCEECGKNKATVHLTEIVNEQISKVNLCEACAKVKGADAEQHFGIADLVAALTDTEPKHTSGSGTVQKNKCPQCGLTYEDFKKTGRLGCGECYTAFKGNLVTLLKKIHGATQHVGKSPDLLQVKEPKTARYKYQEELNDVKDQLQTAVKKEEFEEAAALRDKIKFIEKKLKELSKESHES